MLSYSHLEEYATEYIKCKVFILDLQEILPTLDLFLALMKGVCLSATPFPLAIMRIARNRVTTGAQFIDTIKFY